MKKIKIALCLGVVLACCASCSFPFIMSSKDKAAIQELEQTLESRDVDKIWAETTPAVQAKLGEAGIKERIQHLDERLDTSAVEIKDLKLDRKESSNHTKVYHGTLSLKTGYGNIEGPTTLQAEKIDEEWKLATQPGNFFPGLREDNDVVVKLIPARRGAIYDREGNALALDTQYGRQYPQGALTSAVVGYVRTATETDKAQKKDETFVQVGAPLGRVGIERAYQKELAGVWGGQVTLSDAPDKILASTDPVDGKDLHTTIDLRAQRACYQAIQGEYGAAVILEPSTGAILAAAESPTFLPGNWMEDQLDTASYEAAVAAGRAPLEGNFSQIFLPGSTQKLLTSVIGLNAGVVDTTSNTGYSIYGSRWQPNTTWGGYTVHRVTPINGWITLRQALISSDNIFFARVGLDLGAQRFVDGMKALGISEDIPSRFPIATAQITADNAIFEKEIALADSAYGQAKGLISPMQMSMVYAAMVNGGNIMVPHILLDDAPEVWKASIITPERIQFLNDTFTQVVGQTHPSAYRYYGRMAGKTGTAEVGPGGKQNLGWFIGYDLSNPTACVAVMINRVEDRGGSELNAARFGVIMDSLYQGGQVPYRPATAAQ